MRYEHLHRRGGTAEKQSISLFSKSKPICLNNTLFFSLSGIEEENELVEATLSHGLTFYDYTIEEE